MLICVCASVSVSVGERGGENLKKGREEKKVKRVMGAGKRGGSGEEGEKEGKTYLTERPYANKQDR